MADPFNSLFEMQICLQVPQKLLIKPFNSLFEMRCDYRDELPATRVDFQFSI